MWKNNDSKNVIPKKATISTVATNGESIPYNSCNINKKNSEQNWQTLLNPKNSFFKIKLSNIFLIQP